MVGLAIDANQLKERREVRLDEETFPCGLYRYKDNATEREGIACGIKAMRIVL